MRTTRISTTRALSAAALAIGLIVGGSLTATAADSNDGFYAIPAGDDQSSAAERRWQPRMDFDRDGCLAVAAVDASGTPNPGLKTSGALNGNCHDERDLDNTNVYVRTGHPNGAPDITAYVYAYYFEKDQTVNGCCGHRHDWEHVIVWTRTDESGAENLIAVSTSRHSSMERHTPDRLQYQDGHPLVNYHKDGWSTHAMRAATDDDVNDVQNPRGTWQQAPLLSWERMPEAAKATLDAHDFGSAWLELKDRGNTFQNKVDSEWAEVG